MFVLAPYNYENVSLESSIMAYWVIPPPETKPNEYGRPMLMSYSVIQDTMLLPYIKEEITKCIQYYEKESDFLNFADKFVGNTLYIDKLKSTMISKFPRDECETEIWRFIRESLKCSSDEKEPLISVPSVTKPNHIIPPLNTSLGLNSGLGMLPTDISSLLFNAGKFSSPSSLLGLPDPMAHSTLAANNMFLQSNLFKMQELLKPYSPTNSTSTSTKTSKNDHKSHTSTTLKIPTDIKVSKPDFSMDYLHYKDKMNFLSPDLNIAKTTGKDYSTDYLTNLMKTTKSDFYMPNISITKTSSNPSIVTSTADYSLNLSRPSPTPNTEEEKPAKVAKMDFPSTMLDLSYPKTSTSINADAPSETVPTNLSVSDNLANETSENDAPLNLTGD